MTFLGLSTLVTFNPSSISPDATLEEARRSLDQLRIRHLPVVDGRRRVVGVVSDYDLTRSALVRRTQLVGPGGASRVDRTTSHRRVDELMTRGAILVDLRETPRRALERILDHRIHALPVVEDGRLVGIVTSGDFLRELTYGEMTCYRDNVLRHMAGDSARIDYESTIAEARATLDEIGSEHLAVVRHGRPVGILSLRDIRAAWALEGQDELFGTIAHLVNGSAPIVDRRATLGEVATELLERRCPAAAVADDDGRMIGLVSEDHILQAIAEHLD